MSRCLHQIDYKRWAQAHYQQRNGKAFADWRLTSLRSREPVARTKCRSGRPAKLQRLRELRQQLLLRDRLGYVRQLPGQLLEEDVLLGRVLHLRM